MINSTELQLGLPFFDKFYNNSNSLAFKIKSLFESFDLSALPIKGASLKGPKGYPKTALFRALLLMHILQLKSFPALRNHFVNHPDIFYICGFNPYIHSVPSANTFSRFLRALKTSTMYKIFIRNRNKLLDFNVSSNQASLDCLNIFAPVAENNPNTFTYRTKDEVPSNCPEARLGVKVLSNKLNNSKITYFWGFKAGLTVDTTSEVILSYAFATANTFDSFAYKNSIRQLKKLSYHSLMADAAFDAKNIYNMCFDNSITPFIALNLRNQKMPLSKNDLICEAGLELKSQQPYFDKQRQLYRQRSHCPLKDPSSCPIQHAKCKNFRGCTKYIQFGDNPRFAIDRESEYYKTNYKKRTASERVNSRINLLGANKPFVKSKQSIFNSLSFCILTYNAIALWANARGQPHKARSILSFKYAA